jgi:broad specificity phosphatase PhoE
MNHSDKTFYLVRHGIATHKKSYGTRKLTASILPESIPVIKRLAEALIDVPDSANFSSEIIRCRETSAIITEITKKQFIFDARLNEVFYARAKEIRERVRSFLNDMLILPQKNIIVCTHGVVISAIKNLTINDSFGLKDFNDYPLSGELMIIEGKDIKVKSFN